ncbi:dephospho-CoA kinase [Cyclobacterium xiamenense]|jgi:dephospho-CoA kinase|uniref:dephospho-CoA kinase n=1 Tax=Cyclobacterium xiamenense TaxID=1297121 RepID=UPI0035CFC47A
MTNRKPLLVGITGGIGAGKSLIAQIFSLLGIPVYNADSRAKWLMAHDTLLKEDIRTRFGDSAFTPEGTLNSRYLAERVFADPRETEEINQLVHPVVGQDFMDWASKQTTNYLLKEAALLFETGSYRQLDCTIHVTAPWQLRVERVLKRDPHRSRKQIVQIMEKQWEDDKKNKLATYVVPNDERELVIPQVLSIHKDISQRASSSS